METGDRCVTAETDFVRTHTGADTAGGALDLVVSDNNGELCDGSGNFEPRHCSVQAFCRQGVGVAMPLGKDMARFVTRRPASC